MTEGPKFAHDVTASKFQSSAFTHARLCQPRFPSVNCLTVVIGTSKAFFITYVHLKLTKQMFSLVSSSYSSISNVLETQWKTEI